MQNAEEVVNSKTRMQDQYRITPALFKQLILPWLQRDHSAVRHLTNTGQFFRAAVPEADRLAALNMCRVFYQPKPASIESFAHCFEATPNVALQDQHTLVRVKIFGDSAQARSALINCYANKLSIAQQSTIGIEFFLRTPYSPDHTLRLQLWDTVGLETPAATQAHIKTADLVCYLCDSQNPNSLVSLASWLESLRPGLPDSSVVMVLMRNKSLCTSEQMQQLSQLAERHQIVACHEIDATPERTVKALDVGVRYFLQKSYHPAEAPNQSKCCVM